MALDQPFFHDKDPIMENRPPWAPPPTPLEAYQDALQEYRQASQALLEAKARYTRSIDALASAKAALGQAPRPETPRTPSEATRVLAAIREGCIPTPKRVALATGIPQPRAAMVLAQLTHRGFLVREVRGFYQLAPNPPPDP